MSQSNKHMVSLEAYANLLALFTSEAARPGQSDQLSKPVKSAAAGKTVSDHANIM